MNRRTARVIHQYTNMAFWLENPNWNPDVPVIKLGCKALRALPFSVYEAQKRAFFDTDSLIAVNGETVVAANGADKVDKFMFRYPGKMPLETFKGHVVREVGAVTGYLAGIALPTEVSIKPANIFRHSRPLPTVAQTQQRLDLSIHPALDLTAVTNESLSPKVDKTAKDLEKLLKGTEALTADYGYYPDIGHSAGNLRRSILDGAVTLIDVMPVYDTGTRLIGDRPPLLIPSLQNTIHTYQDFVGQYGS